VFSLGLILWELLTGELPEWPFAWPLPGHQKLRGRVHPDLLALLRRALQLDPKRRFGDARQMLGAFQRIKPRVRRHLHGERRRRTDAGAAARPDWKRIRFQLFQKQHRAALQLDRECTGCGGPVGESMHACPWCGVRLSFAARDSAYPATCPRCHRGRKSDWKYCAHCFGPAFRDVSDRVFPDRRYVARCKACTHPLMAFTRYCPGCRKKTGRRWPIPGVRDRCGSCGWGVDHEYWEHCPWCAKRLAVE
jgi:hypothetical protein